MKLQAERPQGEYAITAYGSGFVSVNGTRYGASLIVGHNRLILNWPLSHLDELVPEHLAGLDEGCDVLLLGTGIQQRFPPRGVLRALTDKRIGVDVMDTAAACRTYNVLLAEGRAVVAALIVE